MNFAEIEKEINTLAKKASDGSISIDEMAGGSFTISNGGVYGSLLSTPIINPPQVWLFESHCFDCVLFSLSLSTIKFAIRLCHFPVGNSGYALNSQPSDGCWR